MVPIQEYLQVLILTNQRQAQNLKVVPKYEKDTNVNYNQKYEYNIQ